MSGAITITSLSATPVSLTGAELVPLVQAGGTFRAPVSAFSIFAPVQTVNGQTGTVIIGAGDIAGLGAVALTNQYADLDGLPVSVVTSSELATVAYTGAYSDLDGLPSLTTLATTSIGVLPAVASLSEGFLAVEQGTTVRRVSLFDLANINIPSDIMQILAEDTDARTLALEDAEALILFDNAAGATITVPEDTNVSFPVGTKIGLTQLVTAAISVSVEGDVILYTPETFFPYTSRQYATIFLTKVESDAWLLSGQLAGGVEDAELLAPVTVVVGSDTVPIIRNGRPGRGNVQDIADLAKPDTAVTFSFGEPEADEVALTGVPFDLRLLPGAPGSTVHALIAPTVTTVYSIRTKAVSVAGVGSEIGTAIIDASANGGTVIVSTTADIDGGFVLLTQAPTTVDATAAGIAITLRMERR
jgi:hypothetical protein